MKLSIVVPLFNEKNTVKEIIKRVHATPFEKEIIIVDDCSTDGSREIVKKIENDYDLKVFYHEFVP